MKRHYMLFFLSLYHFVSICLAKASIPEKPLYIVVTEYNNARFIKKNLDSIFSQNYSNYHVTIVDDRSTDNTATLIEQYIQEHDCQNKVTFIKNDARQWKLKNLYSVYHMASDWDIIVQIDGDDWLPDSNVFQKINEAYTRNDIWITYGSFIRSKGKELEDENARPEYIGSKLPKQATPKLIINSNSFRSWGWNYMPIRTFYAWLFKLVKLEALVSKSAPGFQGQLFPFANDQAMMFPMLEMASKSHIHFFQELMYIASISEKREGEEKINYTPVVRACTEEIRQISTYDPLTKPVLCKLESYLHSKATFVVTAFSSLNLFKFLESINQFVYGYDDICILCQDDDVSPELVRTLMPSKHIKVFNLSLLDEKSAFVDYFHNLKSQHIVLADSNHPFKCFVDLRYYIYFLEKTYAYGFYFNLDFKEKPETVYTMNIEDNVYLWKFIFSKEGEWSEFNTIKGALYKKNNVKNLISHIKQAGMKGFEQWQKKAVNREKIGLFYQAARVTN